MYLETRLSYCLKCKKKTECKNPGVEETKNGRIMFQILKFVVVKTRDLPKNKKPVGY